MHFNYTSIRTYNMTILQMQSNIYTKCIKTLDADFFSTFAAKIIQARHGPILLSITFSVQTFDFQLYIRSDKIP